MLTWKPWREIHHLVTKVSIDTPKAKGKKSKGDKTDKTSVVTGNKVEKALDKVINAGHFLN